MTPTAAQLDGARNVIALLEEAAVASLDGKMILHTSGLLIGYCGEPKRSESFRNRSVPARTVIDPLPRDQFGGDYSLQHIHETCTVIRRLVTFQQRRASADALPWSHRMGAACARLPTSGEG